MAFSDVYRMSPRGRSTASMIESQASMHWVQATHSICSPSRMSMPVGHVRTHAPQSMQSPSGGLSPACSWAMAFLPRLARGSPRLGS